MIRTVHKPVVALMLVVLITSCEVINTDPQGAEVIRKDGKILIRDQTGKNWDITHAVENYGFDPGTFLCLFSGAGPRLRQSRLLNNRGKWNPYKHNI